MESKKEKNDLWLAYQDADRLKRVEIRLELAKVGLYRYFQQTASYQGYNLVTCKTPLKEIFLRVMPETAPYFSLATKE